MTSDDGLIYFPKELINTDLSPALDNGAGDSLANDIALSDANNNLVLQVTAQEYIELLSAAYDGAVRSYPDNWLNVIYPLFKAGKMEFCEQVSNCIDGNIGTQNTLNAYLILSGLIINQINPTETIVEDRFPEADREIDIVTLPTCDLDELWGMCFEVATRLDQLGRDLLETIVSNIDPIERVAILIDAVPLIGTVVSSSILALIENIDDIYNGYLAYSSTNIIEGLACDLFQANCATCTTPSYDDVLDLYTNAGITGIDDWRNIVYQSFVDYLTGSSGLANQVIYFTAISFALYTLYLESTVLGKTGSKIIELWALLGQDNPSSDWSILCGSCAAATWCYDYDFTINDGAWTPVLAWDGNPQGIYQSGIGWRSAAVVDASNSFNNINLKKTPTQATTITMFSVTFDADTLPLFQLPASSVVLYMTINSTNVLTKTRQNLIDDRDINGQVTYTWTGTATLSTNLQVTLIAGFQYGKPKTWTNYAHSINIHIEGDDDIPFGASNC